MPTVRGPPSAPARPAARGLVGDREEVRHHDHGQVARAQADVAADSRAALGRHRWQGSRPRQDREIPSVVEGPRREERLRAIACAAETWAKLATQCRPSTATMPPTATLPVDGTGPKNLESRIPTGRTGPPSASMRKRNVAGGPSVPRAIDMSLSPCTGAAPPRARARRLFSTRCWCSSGGAWSGCKMRRRHASWCRTESTTSAERPGIRSARTTTPSSPRSSLAASIAEFSASKQVSSWRGTVRSRCRRASDDA